MGFLEDSNHLREVETGFPPDDFIATTAELLGGNVVDFPELEVRVFCKALRDRGVLVAPEHIPERYLRSSDGDELLVGLATHTVLLEEVVELRLSELRSGLVTYLEEGSTKVNELLETGRGQGANPGEPGIGRLQPDGLNLVIAIR